MNKSRIEQIKQLASKGFIFYVNHSGGKDSQDMTTQIKNYVPATQIIIIHAHLPEVDWKGTRAHIRATIGDSNYIECQAGKTFFEMVEHRQKWPAPAYRQCTSDLKRGPIQKAIRADMKKRGAKLAVNCIGIRAEESSNRKKMQPFKLNKELSKAGRTIYDMFPIFEHLEYEVFANIKAAGQEPHWAYSKGMSRLSCCFCIMANKKDLTLAAELNPELYRRYVEKEKELDFTLQQGKSLEQTTGIYLGKSEPSGDCWQQLTLF